MRISIGSYMLSGDIRQRFETAQRLGFDGVEAIGRNFEETMPQFAAAAEATDMPISTICAGFRGSPLAPEPAERQQALADIETLLGWAGRLGAVGVIVVPIFGRPAFPDMSPWRTSWQLARELWMVQMDRLSAAAEKAGAVVILEALCRGESRFLNRIEQIVEMLDAAGSPPNVKLMADFFHMNSEEVDAPAAMRAAGDRLVHVHLAENWRRQPGTGSLDFKAHFAALKAIGYRGWGAYECDVLGDDREAALAESLAFVRKAYAEA